MTHQLSEKRDAAPDTLRVSNARGNNLKNLSCRLPHDQLVVVTGLSGSGKSTLAFDTIYAEGQRRYVETFSPYIRQFLDRVKKPDADSFQNVRPALALEQRTRIRNSRSTVGSLTDIDDYLRLIWATFAKAVCPKCGTQLEPLQPGEAVRRLEGLVGDRPKSTFVIAAALSFGGSPEDLSVAGFSRVVDPANGELHLLEDRPELPRDAQGRVMVVLERVRQGLFDAERAREAVTQAYALSDGECLIVEVSRQGVQLHHFFADGRCPHDLHRVRPPKPSLFSYNHPLGACPECKGFGRTLTIDPALVVPDPAKSLEQNAIQCWAGAAAEWEQKQLQKFCKAEGIPLSVAWRDLPAAQRELLLYHDSRRYTGVFPWFQWLETKAYKMHVRVFLSRYRSQTPCPACGGSRLTSDALAYQIMGLRINDAYARPIGTLLDWLREFSKTAFTAATPRQVREIFTFLVARLQALSDLGLPYLTLDRQARTLSGGETQRVNLAAALGSGLVSTQFVLDEPSVGLHPRDTGRLITALRSLTDQGNSLLVVEHDPECIRAADHIVELGPEAGEKGGEIVFNGPAAAWPAEFRARAVGQPLALLRGSALAPAKKVKKTPQPDAVIAIRGAAVHNLKSLSVDIPLYRLVCLTGVSGSGKTTLAHEVIYRAAQARQGELGETPSTAWVSGLDQVSQVLLVDQSPLAKSPRANIATYTGIWNVLRELLARTDEARQRGFSKSSFSFNVDGGRCPVCKGAGFLREDMQFLSDVFVPCELCLGKRFQEPVLEVRLNGYSVHDLLQMSVDRCRDVFSEISSVAESCDILSRLGLGHLYLGHALSELSGGEAQRLKLVPFIQRSGQQPSLLLFDEPTTGLHTLDVRRLLDVFRMLVKEGHSLLVVEHNLQVVGSADWIIDLGPEGGEAGGTVVLQGPPNRFLESGAEDLSFTARALQREISESAKKNGSKPSKGSGPKKSLAASRRTLGLRGAREHNLKDINVEIPLEKMVTITGVSGSGKSTIAKDIIYAEGQRRYLDCLSPYARQFIKELSRPDIDAIENIPPTICVYQHTFQPSRLSTVATMSEVYNYLRLLYAKLGTQYCPDHPDQAISSFNPEELAVEMRDRFRSRVKILAPVVHKKKGIHREVFQRAIDAGYTEVRVDGVFASPTRFLEGLERAKIHTIEFVVGSCAPRNIDQELLSETLRLALSTGAGTVVLHADQEDHVYSVTRACPECHRGFYKPDPEDFAFTSRRGRCGRCQGSGSEKNGSKCRECGGARIGPVGRNVRLDGKAIHELADHTPVDLRDFLAGLPPTLREHAVAAPVLRELSSRLGTLEGMGLEYIALGRSCQTLSGGELQRLRLATALGSPLSGVLYIFDEPTVGLHPMDTQRVLDRLRTLTNRGNSVLMIEHDLQTIRASDYIIDVGPGGGRDGGTIVAAGTVQTLQRSSKSETAKMLSTPPVVLEGGEEPIEWLTAEVSSYNNLQDFSVALPLHRLVSVIGVSGAGKSSLVHGVIGDTLAEGKRKGSTYTLNGRSIRPDAEIDRVLLVDQTPLGRTSRSTPASYLGVWDEIRKLFASSIEAKTRGFGPGYFSFNSGTGRCPECKGRGFITLEMSFLPDAHHLCEACQGTRYTEEAKEVRYLGHNISEALGLTFDEARVLFANHRRVHQPLQQACELGLGYLSLGQDSSTLSGGESQRIKLVSELSSHRRQHTLYILDEPTTGLHKSDVHRLLAVLRKLVSKGHTVLVIEHDEDVILQSDFLVELGPGPGADGGEAIFTGTPSDLLKARTPWGEWARAVIKDSKRSSKQSGRAAISSAANW